MQLRLAIFAMSLLIAPMSLRAGSYVTDRASLCELKYGRQVQSSDKENQFEYVGSTPMEDACKNPLRPQREKICRYNYQLPEVVEACIDTYDAVTEQIRRAAHNSRIN